MIHRFRFINLFYMFAQCTLLMREKERCRILTFVFLSLSGRAPHEPLLSATLKVFHLSQCLIKMRSDSMSLDFSEPVMIGWPVQSFLVDKKSAGLTDSFPQFMYPVVSLTVLNQSVQLSLARFVRCSLFWLISSV